MPGVVDFQPDFSLENLRKFFGRPLYYGALLRSIALAITSAVVALIFGYPLAYLVAKERRPGRANFYMILILASMQLDLIIRMYGLMVLLGDAGLINDALLRLGVISQPLPLMYNAFGVVVGLVQLSLPFMILSLIGIIQGIDPALEEAAGVSAPAAGGPSSRSPSPSRCPASSPARSSSSPSPSVPTPCRC